MLDRILPQAIEIEQSLLCSVFVDPDSREKIFSELRHGDFYHTPHQKIFKAMIDLRRDDKPVELLSVCEVLRTRGDLERIGGAAFVASLVDYPVAMDAAHYCEILKDKAEKRQLIRIANNITHACFDDRTPCDAIQGELVKSLSTIQGTGAANEFHALRDCLVEAVERIGDGDGLPPGIMTGIYDLDRMTNGFQPGDLIVIAARPSMGKTAFGVNNCALAAVQAGKSVCVFSLEMTAAQLTNRILSSRTRVNNLYFRHGKFQNKNDLIRIQAASAELAKHKLFIVDRGNLTETGIARTARRIKQRHGLDLVVIDYLQLISGEQRNGTRESEVAAISRSLKCLSLELSIPVVALSQLNRNLETRTNRRPTLSDIRESGAIEQDADLVCFLYRESMYSENADPHTAELIVSKNRNGMCGKIDLRFDPSTTTFFNVEPTASKLRYPGGVPGRAVVDP